MSRDGSGTYTPPATMAVASSPSSAATVNSIINDIAQALTDSINKDGTKAFAANQSIGGFKLTSLGNGTALTDAVNVSQLQKGNVAQATTVGGTVDAITLNFTPAITSLTTGMKIRWTSGGANTIAGATVNIDSLGAVTLKKNPGAAALVAGDLGVSGTIVEAVYNGTNFVLTSLGADLSAYATSASQVGRQTIWVDASAMTPQLQAPCGSSSVSVAGGYGTFPAMDFDATATEYAVFRIRMPKSWNEGTITYSVSWSHPTTATNFGVTFSLQSAAISDGDSLNATYGAATNVTDTGGTADTLYISPESAAITVSGTPAAEDVISFILFRYPPDANDTLAVDAQVHGVTIYFTTDAATDA